jgi:hypothetical protein
MKNFMNNMMNNVKKIFMNKEDGIDGILVTIGLCVIALVLCVVMKDALITLIQDVTSAMSVKAQQILSSTAVMAIGYR